MRLKQGQPNQKLAAAKRWRQAAKPKVSFRERVFKVVAAIPKGRTFSYSEVARLAGSPRAARAVGNILHQNFDPKIPCHRVIRKDGSLGGYNRGKVAKREILSRERITE